MVRVRIRVKVGVSVTLELALEQTGHQHWCRSVSGRKYVHRGQPTTVLMHAYPAYK